MNTHSDISQFLPMKTLQQIQDGFAAVTGHQISIVDNSGNIITRPTSADTVEQYHHQLAETLPHTAADNALKIPIRLSDQTLGYILLSGNKICESESAVHNGAHVTNIHNAFEQLIDPNHKLDPCSPEAGLISFLHLMSSMISQLCNQSQALSIQLTEMKTLYQISTIMAGQRDLKKSLQTLACEVTHTMNAKACTIKLYNSDTGLLEPAGTYGLSDDYLATKTATTPETRGEIDIETMNGNVVYVEDMTKDPRVLHPEDGTREGLKSILSAGMVYRGKTVGVIRVYTAEVRKFTPAQGHLLKALGQLAAAASWNAELDAFRRKSEHIARQVELAVDVQRTLLPTDVPDYENISVAGRYEPSFELSGDFYDFIPLEESLGIIVGDVVGKGVAAGLIMASVRASLRAHIEDIYDIDDVMKRVNLAMCRDTHDYQFATVFYCTIDTKTRRMTYCSAGHDPGLLIRDGKVKQLPSSGLPLGIDGDNNYEKIIIDLKPGDRILLYTDGVTDAANYEQQRFGRDRLIESALRFSDLNAKQLIDNITWDVNRFTGLNQRGDDMTLVATVIS